MNFLLNLSIIVLFCVAGLWDSMIFAVTPASLCQSVEYALPHLMPQFHVLPLLWRWLHIRVIVGRRLSQT